MGVLKNDEQAVVWYRKAAEQGSVNAQLALGRMYENGYGVPQDYVHAYAWLKFALASGSEEADENLFMVAKKMSLSQIEKARNISCEWMEKFQKKNQ
ncbi:MAG: sel1 repeat family protein [Magnetococcales bacterium]|nr:sel1 repeat family protein [Magnetococcales bacterium]